MHLLFALLSCSLLPAWPARAQPPTVRQIKFEGVHAVSAQELRSHMLTHRPDRLRFWKPAPERSQGALEEDMARIERVYRDHGYYEAEASYTLSWDESRDRVSIAIQVKEGVSLPRFCRHTRSQAERQAGSEAAKLLRQARTRIHRVEIRGDSDAQKFLKQRRRQLSKGLTQVERTVRPKRKKTATRKKTARRRSAPR
jgi:hypothetical protein